MRSYSKINLGLAIGPPRPDGFHALCTLYQTLALHDFVTVRAQSAAETQITITSNDPRVPRDARNTAWKMVERALTAANLTAKVDLEIEKQLPIQGGMGAGSANAAAALLGLERELGLSLPEAARRKMAAEVGSDVPLFLVGGAVLGTDRGQAVAPAPAVTLAGQAELHCCVALPALGVSTPLAFREWDRRFANPAAPAMLHPAPDLHNPPFRDTLEQLSRTYASVFRKEEANGGNGASGIFPEPSSALEPGRNLSRRQNTPENLQGLSREQLHDFSPSGHESGIAKDLAENTLLALVRTGIENDFETVVFAQHPILRDIKRHLEGVPESANAAVYAALSGSGSALFGLYRTAADAEMAQQRCRQHGVSAVLTKTIPRPLYWQQLLG